MSMWGAMKVTTGAVLRIESQLRVRIGGLVNDWRGVLEGKVEDETLVSDGGY